ncbi:DUF418 domain-containing protein [Corynebacterium kozikiae]|uniref:DUF418 domain-containing protein n=1 Tax=Corynebacterium kozikiae TaxID=2968469 RepID=UPI00211C9D45|nr:DUF418 domain-containing protein [Corynebacterium sp. 76QC2CO]MCQ9343902.1 DUF418 domain-containing protein [Corynebacterium sp. 76QC2CO]
MNTLQTQATPAKAAHRIQALDVARGVAILGTFAANVWLFARPFNGIDLGGLVSGPALWEQLGQQSVGEKIESLMGVITDGKFLGLLTLMFGIGLEIQYQSALRRGRPWPRSYRPRAWILMLEGTLNYIFVFAFDVLMGYALTALAVAPLLASKHVKRWMWAGLVVHVSFLSFLVWSSLSAAEAQAGLATEASPYPTSYFAQIQERIINFGMWRFEVPIMFLMGLGMFIVGSRLYRAGLFEPHGAKLRTQMMALGLGAGIPLDLSLRLFCPSAFSALARYGSSSLVALGILSLIAAWYCRRAQGSTGQGISGGNESREVGLIGAHVANVGKMALSCYVGQNIFGLVVFNWFGVGRLIEGEYFTYWVLGFFVLGCALMVGCSTLWLRRFPRGPMETVSHALMDKAARAQLRREKK